MKISYNWLKEYLDIDYPAEELEEILTGIGLEVEGIEEFESIKGGLKGVFVGEVLSCEKHPNADRLNKTIVNIGNETPLYIVCGAPNVAKGQKVLVATVGTTLYSGEESFEIKKSKIRGELSEGMICAEDELQLGQSHEGIMVLPASAQVGTPASAYFSIENDIVFEIGLTPNRIDSASHIGVARDIAAYLRQEKNITYKKPSTADFKIDTVENTIYINVENSEACPRYSGITISGIKIAPSPEWLQNRLKAIGLSPINNVVDVTNYVLHETGQPLHAFDCSQINGNKILVKTLPEKSKFVTLDEVERELSQEDLMICNEEKGMCLAGIFGGLESGVKDDTSSIFLESAYFNPVWIRKSAKRHSLNTDSSFRFERGVDPENTVYALKRAAILIQQIAGGKISSEITDIYPSKIEKNKVNISYKNIYRLIGKNIPEKNIKDILSGLEINIVEETENNLLLEVPQYRVDVTREVDVIEEILRIYGYNNIEINEQLRSSLSYSQKPNKEHIIDGLTNLLVSNGFNEIMSNSLTKAIYYEENKVFKPENLVSIVNPLSSDLSVMRQTLLFGGLEAISYNANRKNTDLRFFEFGYSYHFLNKETEDRHKNYKEDMHLGLFLTGNKQALNWNVGQKPTNFFHLKSYVEKVLLKLGYNLNDIGIEEINSDIFSEGLLYSYNNKNLASFGLVNKKILKEFDLKQDVYFADFNLDKILKDQIKVKVKYEGISKFPEVKRDLALLLDTSIRFEQIKQLAYKTEKKLLKSVNLFDVYEGESLGENKKSYAISFVLHNETKTLKDKEIDKVMNKLIITFEKELKATIR